MKIHILTCLLSLSVVLFGWAAHANTVLDDRSHEPKFELSENEPIGKPGNGALVSRTVEVIIRETASGYMLFEPDTVHIENGSAVRFVINNLGALEHQFFLGTHDEVARYQQWIRQFPDMAREDATAISVQRGETAELIRRFSSPTNLEFVCLIPGHREAGLSGLIVVHDHLAPKSKS